MKYIATLSFLSVLAVTGCGQSSKEDEQVSEVVEEVQEVPSGEPITLHARLDFMDALVSPSINASRKLNASIYLATDVVREGSGDSALYSLDSEETRVQGAVVASGQMDFNQDEVSTNETYNMQAGWSSITNNPDGKYRINLPDVSYVGDGLRVGIEVEVPMTGTKKATISSNGQTLEGDVTHARSMFCSTQSPEKDICTLTFTIDALPTKAKEPVYESLLEGAKAAYAYQGKQDANGGLIMYSGMVPVYGATTQYQNGHFVTQLNEKYSVNLDGSDISQHIQLTVWSTKRGDSWQPNDLPPLQTPEQLQ